MNRFSIDRDRHSLASYLPKTLLRRLAAGPLNHPEVRRTAGAVLLSDIQGFTAFVERFSAAGRKGLEELTWLLNQYIADVAGAVEVHGGDVISIAGDAFFCHWPAAPPDTVLEAVLRAAQAGEAIQRALHDAEAKHGRQLPTRIGIGVGDLVVGYAGGIEGRWEVVVSGDAITDVTPVEKAATPGSVLISANAWAVAGSACEGRTGSAGGTTLVRLNQPPRPVPQTEAHTIGENDVLLRAFVPPSVLDRLVANEAGWLAESRPVTVMLAHLRGMADASESEIARVHEAVRKAQNTVLRFAGTLRVDVDDKGLLLLAVFGLPPRAHEDDAARALLAAADLTPVLAAADASGIGIATGRALCGSFGSDVRRDYIVRGDVINLAARLMQAGAGGTVCDGATVQSSRGRLTFAPLDPISVRGRSDRVPVFRPLRRTAASVRTEHSVIGRVRELDILTRQIESARAGEHAGVVLIEGDAGLGKSRLATEAARLASDAGVRVLTAAADAIEQSTAYYAWRPMFGALFDIGPDDDARAIADRVAHHMAAFPGLERLLPLLSGVLPVQFADTPLTSEMSGDVRADNTRNILRQILQHAVADRPTMLVLEDAHWLDSASWSFLLDVVQDVRPLCIIVASRPFVEPAPREWQRLVRAAGERRLTLKGLSPEETVSLVHQRLGVAAIPDALATFVTQRVDGHPFFCEELLRAMQDSGVIRLSDGTCTVGDLTRVDLPTTVEGVIVSRLDRLTPGQQLCLKVASVIGRVFRARMVQETHPVESERPLVGGHLGALTAADLTAVEAPEPALAYLFKHVITRDVAYESMPYAQRQPLHRSAALWYERHHADDLAPHYALLAYHWARAADATKAVHYLDKASEQALIAGAFRETVVFLTQAIDLVDSGHATIEPFRRALWDKSLARAHYYLGALHTSREHNERAVAALHRRVPATNGGVAMGVLAEMGRQIGHRLLPRRYLGRRVAEKAALDEAVECYKNLGQAYYLEAEPPLKLLYVTVSGLNAGEEAGPSAALARVMINGSILAHLVGMPGQCEWYAKRAIEMAEREGLSAAAYVWHIRALSLAQRAAWTDAKAANERAQTLTLELGDRGLEAEVLTTRTTIALCEGDFAFAATGWRRQREIAERNDNAALKCWSYIDETDTWLGQGETEKASQALAGALAITLPPTDIGTHLDRARSTAVTRCREGRDQEAVRAADEVFDTLRRNPPTGYQWAEDFATVVEVYLDLLARGGEYTDAHRAALEERAERGHRLLARFSRTYWNVRPRASLLLGMTRRLQGRHRAARRAFDAAARVADAMLMPFELARAQRELAREARGDERRRLLAESASVFGTLGATYYLTEDSAGFAR
jgi:class 3 adenylate cyclase